MAAHRWERVYLLPFGILMVGTPRPHRVTERERDSVTDRVIDREGVRIISLVIKLVEVTLHFIDVIIFKE